MASKAFLKILKLLLPILFGSLFIVITVLWLKAFLLSSPHNWGATGGSLPDQRWIVDRDRRIERAQRLAAALAIPTISWEDGSQDPLTFLKLHEYIQSRFPKIHSAPFITMNVINRLSLLYEVRGDYPPSEQMSEAKPYLLTGHMDVVPIADNGSWRADPFGGLILDGNVIYGRGAIDDKHSVMGILEALEFLLERDFRPKRTFYIGFGHDEEISGTEGAKKIAEELRKRGVNELDFILDEGLFILEGFMEGIDRPMAVIGVAEKGYATLELTVNAAPGHSSIPPKTSAIGILAKALSKLEDNPQPNLFGSGPEQDFFATLAPFADSVRRLTFSNMWLLSPLIKRILASRGETDALQRTTTAITVIDGGYKSNVIPARASALVNHRIHPGQTLQEVIAHDRSVMGDDRVEIAVQSHYPAMKVSPYGPGVPQYALIARSIQEVFPDAIVAPACSPAYTDLQQYQNLSSNLYRLTPNTVTPVTQKGLHGNDEQITVDEYHSLIQVYVRVIINADLLENNGACVNTPKSDL